MLTTLVCFQLQFVRETKHQIGMALPTQLVAHAGNILKAKSECPVKIVFNILSHADIDSKSLF